MDKFARLASIAALLPEPNIDTDVIFPARYLSVLERHGLGKYLFYDRRFTRQGEMTNFVLNRPPYNKAQILVTDDNFGSGSSREQAVWALVDFGIRCLIAPGFGEIFMANCYLNGVLPIVLPQDEYLRVSRAAGGAGAIFDIDLNHQQIKLPSGEKIGFTIEAAKRSALLSGLDEVGQIHAENSDAIRNFMRAHEKQRPWLFLRESQFKTLFAGKDDR